MMAKAIRHFLAQDYPCRELVILDDSPGAPAPPEAPETVRYFHERPSPSLGEKRNRAIDHAHGGIIVHWDDDDWMSSSRLSYQVEELLRTGRDACGIDRMVYYDSRTRRAWLYRYPPTARPWVAGGSLCYRRAAWAPRRFRSVTRGEDTQFLWSPPPVTLHVHENFLFYVALIHGSNTCAKPLDGPCWTPWRGPAPRELMGADWEDW
jgi:glycosyltransferase involved in cell wall biosynthesis